VDKGGEGKLVMQEPSSGAAHISYIVAVPAKSTTTA